MENRFDLTKFEAAASPSSRPVKAQPWTPLVHTSAVGEVSPPAAHGDVRWVQIRRGIAQDGYAGSAPAPPGESQNRCVEWGIGRLHCDRHGLNQRIKRREVPDSVNNKFEARNSGK